MTMKIVGCAGSKINEYIPTRFDDIQKEIIAERMKNWVEAYKKYTPQIDLQNETYQLGDVIGKKLSKII